MVLELSTTVTTEVEGFSLVSEVLFSFTLQGSLVVGDQTWTRGQWTTVTLDTCPGL